MSSRRDFLENVRVARNLFVHGRATSDSRRLDPAASTQAIIRAAIWLTPKVVESFNEEDFAELGPARQRALGEAVREFESVSRQVPANEPASGAQLGQAGGALLRIYEILDSYLPAHDEELQIQNALAKLEYPSWVRNWDFEPGSNEDGEPSVWVTLYADEGTVPPELLGKRATEMIPKIRAALRAAGVRRWPYLRVWTAREYQTQS
jgi:hypothetical protein